MQAARGKAVIALLAVPGLSACGNGTPELMNLRTADGPDEFGIVPPKPLEMPESLSDLPEPTLGGSNRTDRNPEADAVVALGGKPGSAGGIPAGSSRTPGTRARGDDFGSGEFFEGCLG